ISSLIAFLVGALIGGRLGAAMSGTLRRWLFIVAICEAALLFAAAFISIRFDRVTATPASHLYAIIILTAVAMGLRNATVRKMAIPDLTTTALTLALTGLVADSSLAGGNNPHIWRRIASILFMFAGAAIGTLLLRRSIALPLILSGMCVL